MRALFLAWGMATWSSQRSWAALAPPVLLRQAHITPKGRAEESFEISLPGEWELNPTLACALTKVAPVAAIGTLLTDDDNPVEGPTFPRVVRLVRLALGR